MKNFIYIITILVPHLLCGVLPTVDQQIDEYERIFSDYRTRKSVARFEVDEDFDPSTTHIEALYTEKLPQLKEYYAEFLEKESDPLRLQAFKHLMMLTEKAHKKNAFSIEAWNTINVAASLIVSDYENDPIIALFELVEPMENGYRKLVQGEAEELSELFFIEEDEDDDSSMMEFAFVSFIYHSNGELALDHFYRAFGLQLGLVGVPAASSHPQVHGGFISQPLSFVVHDLIGHWEEATEEWPKHYDTFELLYSELGERPNEEDLLAFFLLTHEFVPDETEVSAVFGGESKLKGETGTMVDLDLTPETLAEETNPMGRFTLAMLGSRFYNARQYNDLYLSSYISDLIDEIFEEADDESWILEDPSSSDESATVIVINDDQSIYAKIFRKISINSGASESEWRVYRMTDRPVEFEIFVAPPDEQGMALTTVSSQSIVELGLELPEPTLQVSRQALLLNYAADYAKMLGIELADSSAPTLEEARVIFMRLDEKLVGFYERHRGAFAE